MGKFNWKKLFLKFNIYFINFGFFKNRGKEKKLLKKRRKEFTLVKLLVVIAILANISTVSYLGFTNEAKKSNDLTELSQYKTIIEGKLLDGEEVGVDGETTYTFTCNNG